jgi:hypothetical protein
MNILSGDEYSLLIRKAKLEDLERIVDFNIQMAKETEEKILEKNVVQEGVKAVLNNESKRFFLLAKENKDEKNLWTTNDYF